MGAALGRIVGRQAAPAAFPHVTTKPLAQATRPVEPEMLQGHAIAQALSQTNIVNQPKQTVQGPSAALAMSLADNEKDRMPVESLANALLLHAQDPALNTSEALAVQYKLSGDDVASLQSALEHCVPFRVEETDDDKLLAVPMATVAEDWRKVAKGF